MKLFLVTGFALLIVVFATARFYGSDFVSNQVGLSDGSIKRSVVFENEDYCFAPIQERDINFIPPFL
jgi:hypothetical protein